MKYYSVALAHTSVWSQPTLTYKSRKTLALGEIVSAPLGQKTVFGVVVDSTQPPVELLPSIKEIQSRGYRLTNETLGLYRWMEEYYPTSGAGHLQKFLPSFIDDKLLQLKSHVEDTSDRPQLDVTLTSEQKEAVSLISEHAPKPIVLHGITGSGKTTIYAEQIVAALHKNRQALLVVPEISLISHLSRAIQKITKHIDIYTYHSGQTVTENKEAWIQARVHKKPTLFIGTRSSLFLPFTELGIVIVDEAHEYSLKEDHENSHYHGLFVAAALAKQHSGRFIIGSATPPVPETYLMAQKGAKIVCLHSIAKKDTAHENGFTIVDINDDERIRKTSSLISKPVAAALSESLSHKEQSLLFLNKLGSAHIVECDECGWRATCPRCDTHFVYHHDTHHYRCNICGLSKRASNICDSCGGKLHAKSLAIKSVESEVKKLFPTATIARFDSTNKKSESIGELYEAVHKGEYDIIIGTQLMAKGFDFPLLSTVAVLNADALLSLPDINTEERLFAQLVQVAGRVGRGHRKSSVYVQTRQAGNTIFSLVRDSDWHQIYERELLRRKKHNFPPYVFVAKITIKGSQELTAKSRAHEVKSKIKNVVCSEPFQAFYHKRKNNYYWQIICKSKHRDNLLALSSLRNKYVDIDFDPVTLL